MPSDDPNVDRRTYLKFAGAAAAAVGVAGCGGQQAGEDTPTLADETPTPMPEGTPTTTPGTEADTATPGMETESPTGTDAGTGTPAGEEFAVTITQGQLDSGLDPQDHRETPTDNIVRQAYEGVLNRDRAGKVVEELATGYERIEDGRVRFTLREDVTFHNGDPLTPEDVAYSINRIVDENVGFASPQSDQLAGVTGAEVVDGERAVEVTSDGLNPIVFGLFATYCDVMQRSWVEENDENYINSNMNGTGPFRLDSYTADEEVVFARNEDYWREPAAISQLTFTAAAESSTRVNQLLGGETDVIVNVPPQDISRVRGESSTRVGAVPSTRVIFNAMRYDVEPFSSRTFRQAMNYAVDLESIIENVLSGFADPTGQPTLEGFVGHNPEVEPYPYDPDQAETLVEESGHAGAKLTLHTPVGRYLKDVEIAQAVGNYIDELPNVSCEVQQRDFESLVDELLTGNIEDKPPFYLIGWGNATFDASQTIIPLVTTGGALTTFEDPEVDELVTQAQSESDPDERASLLREANAMLHERAPWVFLNRQYSVYGISQRVQWKPRRDEAIEAYAMEPK